MSMGPDPALQTAASPGHGACDATAGICLLHSLRALQCSPGFQPECSGAYFSARLCRGFDKADLASGDSGLLSVGR